MTEIQRRGLMFVLSAPSGAGKTTLAKQLLAQDANLNLSISATTREKRPTEIEGQDYIFLTEHEFITQRDQGDFLEWAEVFNNFYGTPRQFVEAKLAQGSDILFDIDGQGCAQLKDINPDDVVSIFVLPPSGEVLEQRLRNRAQDSEESVQRRMAGANREIQYWHSYDYVIVNDDLEQSLKDLKAILSAERLKRSRQDGLNRFVQDMMAKLHF